MFSSFQGLSYYTYAWCDLCQYLHREETSSQVKHFDIESNHLNTAANCRKTTLNYTNISLENKPEKATNLSDKNFICIYEKEVVIARWPGKSLCGPEAKIV